MSIRRWYANFLSVSSHANPECVRSSISNLIGHAMDWLTFSIVIACLMVSAFFAASETALTGASRASMLRLSKQGNREAGVVTSLMAMRERMIGALLLGNNIATIVASPLATALVTAWFGEVGVLYATGLMTALV